jgi:hypothetical protein
VLLGKNNSGKSAIARVPLVVKSALTGISRAPIDLDLVGLGPSVTFLDLLYGRRPHGAMSLFCALETDSHGPCELSVRIQNIDEYQMQVVSDFRLRWSDQELRLRWDTGDPRAVVLDYLPGDGPSFQPSKVPFRGILPDTSNGALSQLGPDGQVSAVIQAVRASMGDVRYLGPFREQPQRQYRTPSVMPAAWTSETRSTYSAPK